MSQKKTQKKESSSSLPTRTIQMIAVGLLVLAIVVIVGVVVNNQLKKGEKEILANAVNPELLPASEVVRKTYQTEPEMQIDIAKQYTATVKMAKGGEFVIQLLPDKAPRTVNSFVFLAREKFFDGTTFHRVLEGFMAQGGDPTGKGSGGPGYEFVNEDSDLTFDKPGVVAMANAGRDTNGSQFFITFVPTPQLNGDYTIFGQVISGMDVVNAITRRDPNKFPDFQGDMIESITISEE